MHPYRDPPAIIYYCQRTIFIHNYFNVSTVSCKMLINGIVNYLPNQMVQAFYIRAADIHAGSLPDSFQSLKCLYVFGTITPLLFTHIFYLQNRGVKVQNYA